MATTLRARGYVLIVDDDELLRHLVRDVLEADGYVCLDASSGEQALELVRKEQPFLALVDIHLAGISGYEVCRKIKDEFGDNVPVLFVSGERTESFDRVAGLMIGADDYLTKPFAPDELLARVRRLTRRAAPASRALASKLTPRELEVLRLLAFGMSQNEIAGHLVLSPKTIGTHIEHIFLKLGVQSRAQAIALAYRDDLMDAVDLAGLAGDKRSKPGATEGVKTMASARREVPGVARGTRPKAGTPGSPLPPRSIVAPDASPPPELPVDHSLAALPPRQLN